MPEVEILEELIEADIEDDNYGCSSDDNEEFDDHGAGCKVINVQIQYVATIIGGGIRVGLYIEGDLYSLVMSTNAGKSASLTNGEFNRVYVPEAVNVFEELVERLGYGQTPWGLTIKKAKESC